MSSATIAVRRVLERLALRSLGVPAATTAYTVAKIRIPMRDGVELGADLYRPSSEALGTLHMHRAGPPGVVFVSGGGHGRLGGSVRADDVSRRRTAV